MKVLIILIIIVIIFIIRYLIFTSVDRDFFISEEECKASVKQDPRIYYEKGIDTADCLAKAIDQQIHSNYCLFPSNIVAWQSLNPDKKEILVELKSKWPNEDWLKAELDFKNHLISCLSDEFLKIAIQIYAEPVNSRLMYPI